jgi:hypothetical protein
LIPENERLPFELGWHKNKDPLTFEDLLDAMDRVLNSTSTTPAQKKRVARLGGIHAGFEI